MAWYIFKVFAFLQMFGIRVKHSLKCCFGRRVLENVKEMWKDVRSTHFFDIYIMLNTTFLLHHAPENIITRSCRCRSPARARKKPRLWIRIDTLGHISVQLFYFTDTTTYECPANPRNSHHISLWITAKCSCVEIRWSSYCATQEGLNKCFQPDSVGGHTHLFE